MKFNIVILLYVVLLSSAFTTGLIDISYSPYTISQPGSYIVVCDLTTGQNLHCITIETSFVTIDLNGHTLYGAGTAVGSSGCGIYGGSSNGNIIVMNGTICNFRASAIYFPYSDSYNNQVTKIRAYRNSTGISPGSYSTIWDNTVYGNNIYGIYAGSGSTIIDNSVSSNGNCGIYTYYGCIITNNTAYQNRVSGIEGGVGSTISGNNVYGNNGDGILVSSDCQVIGNTISNHWDGTYGRGIRVYSSRNRIDSNHIVNNRVGIQFEYSTNWYGRNSFSGNSFDTSGSAPVAPGIPYTNIFF